MALKPLTNPNMFNAAWTEKDEAVLIDLLKRKIGELRFDIKDSNSPYVKARLRAKRKEYIALLDKVERGDYNSSILSAEIAAAKLAKQSENIKKERRIGKYVDSYEDINFDFQGYFRKTRYFGTALPFFSLILVLLLTAMMVFSVFVPQDTVVSMEDRINDFMGSEKGGQRLTLTSVGYFKIPDDSNDPLYAKFYVKNNGDWPKGTFSSPEKVLKKGELYTDSEGNTPTNVHLRNDLGMETIDITTVEVFKAFFRTPLMASTSISIIENLNGMKGGSWYYYYRYIMDREDEIKIQRGEDGKYNPVVIVQNIGTYGTIAFLIIAFVLLILEIAFCIGRLFSYTSRRLHVVPLLIFICLLLAFICPVFADIGSLDVLTVKNAFISYFAPSWEGFIEGSGDLDFNFFYFAPLVIMFTVLLLPALFRNRTAKQITYVPKGNRPHTYPGQEYPTRPGKVPNQILYPPKKKPQNPYAINPNRPHSLH